MSTPSLTISRTERVANGRLLSSNAMPGTSLASVVALMLMHVTAGAITIGLLTTRTIEQ